MRNKFYYCLTGLLLLIGCGNYTVDTRINDIWVVEKLNGKEINRKLFSKRRPYFELHLRDKTILGFLGCNQFSGKFKLDEKSLTIENDIVLTRLSCGNLQFENDLIKSILAIKFQYKIKSGKLLLLRDGHIILQAQKTD